MNKIEPVIRLATARDAKTIGEFNVAMALESEGGRLDRDTAAKGAAGVFTKEGRGFYLVATIEGTIVGQVMITYEWSDWRNSDFWWIQSVYVVPGHRGQGLFKRLYRKILEMAKEAGNVCGLRLYVDKNNAGARKTYEALGLHVCHYDMMEVDLRP